MANCVKSWFSLNLQLFSIVLKNAPVKYITSYCPWDLHQIHSPCTSMSLWWQNSPSLWLSWTVSILKWGSILWHAACAPSHAKLLEGGVGSTKRIMFILLMYLTRLRWEVTSNDNQKNISACIGRLFRVNDPWVYFMLYLIMWNVAVADRLYKSSHKLTDPGREMWW